MAGISPSFTELGALDQLSRQDTPVHRLDPRAKIVAVMAFVLVTISFGAHEVLALVPMVLFPVVLGASGRVPPGVVAHKVLYAAPFILLVGIANPFLDREVVARFGDMAITGGLLSFASIVLRSLLTLSAALLLVAVTGMPALCAGLERLGVPRAFVVQLLFLYRYLFVLAEEGLRVTRARALRSFGGRGMGVRVASSILGHLLLRTLDRAERIHAAMSSRGFTGEVRLLRPMRAGWREAAFVAGWCAYFAVARIYNLPHLLGRLVTGGLG